MKQNPPNAHRSQIKMCEKRQTRNVQFRFMQNAFRILKPIQKSSKCVSVFRNTGANAFAKIQMRLAYEDKRDLYCTLVCQCSSFGSYAVHKMEPMKQPKRYWRTDKQIHRLTEIIILIVGLVTRNLPNKLTMVATRHGFKQLSTAYNLFLIEPRQCFY